MSKSYILGKGEDLVTKFEFLRNTPGYMVVTDSNAKYQCISNDLAVLLGWSKSEEATGKGPFDIPSKASEGAELFIFSDKKAIELDCKIIAVQVFHCTSDIIGLLIQKNTIKNHENTVIGTIFHAIDITEFILRKYQSLDQTDKKFVSNIRAPRQYILSPSVSPLPLTLRQQECLSLLVRGKPLKEIAYILGISIRTVETHFNSIKHKLGCYNKSQLIEKAIDSGFLFHVPESLFGLNLFK